MPYLIGGDGAAVVAIKVAKCTEHVFFLEKLVLAQRRRNELRRRGRASEVGMMTTGLVAPTPAHQHPSLQCVPDRETHLFVVNGAARIHVNEGDEKLEIIRPKNGPFLCQRNAQLVGSDRAAPVLINRLRASGPAGNAVAAAIHLRLVRQHTPH